MKNTNQTQLNSDSSSDDDDEFARYLASYLTEREDLYLVETAYGYGATVAVHKLEEVIRKFINDLP